MKKTKIEKKKVTIINRGDYPHDHERVVYYRYGNQFEEVGYEFHGFPANGIWFVHEGEGYKSQECIIPLDSIRDLDLQVIKTLIPYKEELVQIIMNKNNRTINDQAAEIIKLMSRRINDKKD